MMLRFTVSLFFLALAHEEGGMSMNAPTGAGDFLAVEFGIVDDMVGQHDGATWICVNLVLRPEEGSKYERFAEVDHRPKLSKASDDLKKAEAACFAKGGTYTRTDSLRAFVDLATGNAAGTGTCDANSRTCVGEEKPLSENPSSKLYEAIKGWNDRFYDMDSPVTREMAVRYHARGSEARHLSQEVRHFVMPREVQKRITDNLATHREAIFGNEGAGQGGTTGAHFLSGNVGFGQSGEGANLMDLIFVPSPNAKNCTAKSPTHEDQSYPRSRGGVLFGDHNDDNNDDCDLAPDMQAYQTELLRTILARSDAQYFLGDDVDVKWQHRLWRFGPDFDPKTKGGIWHKDTCPFGINGAIPEGFLMFKSF
jgi:hypothetical protein